MMSVMEYLVAIKIKLRFQGKTIENIVETTKIEIAKKIIILVAEELESRKVEK